MTIPDNNLERYVHEEENSDLLSLGKVVGIHGVRGEIKVLSSGALESLVEQEEVFLRRPDQQTLCRRAVRLARPHKNVTLLSLEGIDSADEARQYVGNEILVDRSKLPPLPPGEYYWSQIQGLRVETREGQRLGRVERLITTRANDVYVVREGDREILIPAVEEIIHRIDLEEGLMVVDLPEGLPDTDAN